MTRRPRLLLAGVAAVVVLLVAALAVPAWWQHRKAQQENEARLEVCLAVAQDGDASIACLERYADR